MHFLVKVSIYIPLSCQMKNKSILILLYAITPHPTQILHAYRACTHRYRKKIDLKDSKCKFGGSIIKSLE